jgi:hypothetical protein
MRSPSFCRDIAKGIIIGLVREGISPADRELILIIALRGTQMLNAKIRRRRKANGSKPA